MEKYKEIINLPHPVSTKHKHMSVLDRAAQFAPFAALTGFEDDVAETARFTDTRVEMTEDSIGKLDETMNSIVMHLAEHPVVNITIFVDDEKKAGGRYVDIRGAVKRIDSCNRQICLEDGKKIDLSGIVDIELC